MNSNGEIQSFLQKHLQSIFENDIETYHETTGEDLTLYEWWVTPHRIDGLPFHDFMMAANARRSLVFGAEVESSEPAQGLETRFDLANLHIQHYDDFAIASYTLLLTTATDTGVKVISHNESRVMTRIDGAWRVVHVHKSPDWPAPHVDPAR